MKSYKDYENYRKLPIDVPGLSEEMAVDLERRIVDFEDNHLDDALNGKDGFVPRIKRRDIIIGATVNGIIALYYIWALLS